MNGPRAGELRTAPGRWEGPRLLLRTLVTALVTTCTFILTNILNQDASQVWSWTVSVAAGGAALILQFLMDFDKRLRASEEVQERRVRELRNSLAEHHSMTRAALDESFANINAATELFSQVDGSVLRSDGVTRLARTYTHVGERDSEFVKTFAQEEMRRLAALMEDLSNGIVDCPGENHEWLIDLTTCATMTLDAISTPVDQDFWSSEPATRYLAAQDQAITRGVEIRRLFLVSRPDEVTESLRQLCEEQRSLGIDTRIAVQSLLEPRVQRTPLNDFIIFDGELCYETEPDVRGLPAKTTLRMRRPHVQGRMDRFNALWEASEPEWGRKLPGARPALPTGTSPTGTSPAACRLRLTLLDEHPAPRTPARIQLRVQPGPEHPWSRQGADAPLLTAVAIPLTPALIEPVSVPLRPCPSGDDGTAEVLFTPELAGDHRIRVTVHDRATGTVLQQVETAVHVADPPGEHPPLAPFARRTGRD